MFAGKMKLRNFLILVAGLGAMGVAGVGALVVGGVIALGSGTPEIATAPGPVTTAPVAEAPPVAAPTVNVPPGGMARRAWDQVVFDNKGRDLHGDKLKDVSKGQAFKVNLYQDAGKTGMNRAKVDIDRDDKWDEKYTLDGDAVTLQTAPDDDENYTRTYLWNGTAWAAQ